MKSGSDTSVIWLVCRELGRTLVEGGCVGRIFNRCRCPWIGNDDLILGIIVRGEWEISTLPKKTTIPLLFAVDLELNHVLQSRVDVNLDKVLSPLKCICVETLRVGGALERLPTK